LKESDVGLAMGIAGTEVAKEAADIVIMDDNFKSIVQAVRWGRCVFSNIRKFLQFQLTVNVVALVVSFIAAIVGGETPLNVLQLLWVNLIMDTLAALALATEGPTDALLDEKPHGREEPLINFDMFVHIILQSVYQLIVIFIVLYSFPSIYKRYEVPEKEDYYYDYCTGQLDDFPLTKDYDGHSLADRCVDSLNCDDDKAKCWLKEDNDPNPPVLNKADDFKDDIEDDFEDEHDDAEERKNSVIFNAFIFMQIFNEVNSRKIMNEYNILSGVFDSPIFCLIFIGITGLQVLIMFTPMRTFFKVDALNGWEWLFSLIVGIGVIPFSTLIRFVLRNFVHRKRENNTSDNV
jgi:Ca2+-transporting ATPase